MGFPTVTYREQLGKIGQLLIDELDQLVAQIQGFLSREHKSTGAHKAITADSITVSGDVDIAGTTHIGSNLTVTPTTFGQYGDFTLGSFPDTELGLQWPQGLSSFYAWQLTAKGGTPPDSSVFAIGHALAFGTEILKVRPGIAGVGNGWYVVPEIITAAGQGGVFLGDPVTSELFDTVYAKNLNASTAIYERGRTTPVGEWTVYTPTWASNGTQPALGNGTLLGKWMRVGKTVHFAIHLTTGSTSTYGTGSYVFPLPSTTGSTLPSIICGGDLTIFDSSAAAFIAPGTCSASAAGSTTVFGITATGALLGATVPITFATSDQIRITGFYEEA